MLDTINEVHASPISDLDVTGLATRIYSEHGVMALLIAAVVGVTLLAFYETLKVGMAKLFTGETSISIFKKKPKVAQPLHKNNVFARLDSLIEYKVPSMGFSCPLRRKVFRKLLLIRLHTIRDTLMEYAKMDWNVDRDGFDLRWDTFFSRIVHTWKKLAFEADIPAVAIIRFEEELEKVNFVIVGIVMGVCTTDEIYDSNEERVVAIFDILGSVEISSLLVASDVLNILNGELSQHKFEGVGCETCTNDPKDCKTKRKPIVGGRKKRQPVNDSL